MFLILLLLIQILYIPEFLCKSEINFSDNKDGLVSVAVIFRHGDRTPIDPYPKDPYRDVSYWPVGFGQLTNTGKMQHFQLGQWLRNRYRDFLPDQYSKKDIYVRSTDVDRTLMSAGANLAGLFPPQGNQVWNEDIRWQPIPIHTSPKQDDNILAMKIPCHKYDNLIYKLLKSPLFVQMNKTNQDLYGYISRNSGAEISSLEGLQYIYSILKIETLYNFTLPKWTKRIFPAKLKPLAEFSFAVPCYTPDLARLKVGPLWNNILDRFTKATQLKGQKFSMYSGHDITIANILQSLGVFRYHYPPYAATILLELRFLNGTFFVNILYKNTSIPQEIVLQDCEYYCPLEKFVKILEPIQVSPEQWEGECKMKFFDISPFSALQSTVLVGCAIFFVAFLGCLVFNFICTKMRNEKEGYLRIRDAEC